MANLIDHLKAFNRKERFILLHEALGFHGQSFRMSANFSQRLGDCLGVRVPENAFVAMDYHLDWLQIALLLADHEDTEATFPTKAWSLPINRTSIFWSRLKGKQRRGSLSSRLSAILIGLKTNWT